MSASTSVIAASSSARTPWDGVRFGAMVAIMLVTQVGAEAFHDLRSVSNISVSEQGAVLNQILFAFVGVVVAATLAARGLRVLAPLASWPATLMLCWFVINTLSSTHVDLSMRRFALLLICFGAAATMFLLASSVRQFALVLGWTMLGILIVCYVSLLVVPDLAIHSVFDVREPEHDGDWRGVYPHKNAAGSAMVFFVFVGLFVARAASPGLGAVLAVLSTIFLIFTRAKTSVALLPFILIQSWLFSWRTGTWWRTLVVLGPLALLVAVTIGPLYVPALKTAVDALVPDPTFTGRTEIWEFAADNIDKRPLTGFGYGAFWQTESTFFGASDSQTWVNTAGDAHDGYLNTALDLGIPGLILTLLWHVIDPLRSLQSAKQGRAMDPISLFLVRCWTFGLLASVFEGVFYHATNPGFFAIMLSVFGLRYRTQATFRAA